MNSIYATLKSLPITGYKKTIIINIKSGNTDKP